MKNIKTRYSISKSYTDNNGRIKTAEIYVDVDNEKDTYTIAPKNSKYFVFESSKNLTLWLTLAEMIKEACDSLMELGFKSVDDEEKSQLKYPHFGIDVADNIADNDDERALFADMVRPARENPVAANIPEPRLMPRFGEMGAIG